MRVMTTVSVAILAIALAGCGSTKTKTVTAPATPTTAAPATTTPASTPSTTAPTTTPAATPTAGELKIGQSETLAGNRNEKVKVTLVSFIDPVTPGQYDQPPAGQRLVGAVLKLTNVGTVPYDDSPGNGALVILSDDTQIRHVITGSSTTQCDYVGSVKLSPGETRRGCVGFEVGAKAKLKQFQFALNSGYADQKAIWALS